MESPELPEEIRLHYETEIDEDARIRTGLARLELERTQHIVRSRLPGGKLRILDVGGATGVHSEWLLQDGHRVDLVEPVESQSQVAADRLGPAQGFEAHTGNALALDFPDDTFDAVLLMGPLYHLTAHEDRVRALREVGRVARPGGVVFGAAISRFAGLLDGLQRGFLFDPEFRAIVEGHITSGQHRNPNHRAGWFTTAFFHHPDELAAEVEAAGLTFWEVLGVEGPSGLFPDLAERWDEPDGHAAILWAAELVEAERALLGASPHLIVVAQARG